MGKKTREIENRKSPFWPLVIPLAVFSSVVLFLGNESGKEESICKEVIRYYDLNSNGKMDLDKERYNLMFDLEQFTGKNYLDKPLGYEPSMRDYNILYQRNNLEKRVD